MIENSRFNVNVPCEGEVLYLEEENNTNQETYKVRVFLPNGSEIVINNVGVASMFGDPLNTSRIRLRPAFVKNEKQEVLPNNKTIGDRVIVSFLGGNIRRPIITGLLPHVESENKLKDKDKDKPSLCFSYNGIDLHIDDEGQLEIIHNGSATRENRKIEENNNKDNITTLKVLNDGTLDIIDSNKQNVRIDTTKENIFIGTNKSSITIDLKNEKVDIKTNKEVNITTESCTVKSSKITEVQSPHIIMDTKKGCKAEFKNSQWEIKTPTFAILKDTESLLQNILQNAPQTTFHPAIGFTLLNVPQNIEITKQISKIKTSRLK